MVQGWVHSLWGFEVSFVSRQMEGEKAIGTCSQVEAGVLVHLPNMHMSVQGV